MDLGQTTKMALLTTNYIHGHQQQQHGLHMLVIWIIGGDRAGRRLWSKLLNYPSLCLILFLSKQDLLLLSDNRSKDDTN